MFFLKKKNSPLTKCLFYAIHNAMYFTLNISLKFIYFFVNDALMYDRKFFNHKMHLVKDVLFYLNVSATPPFFIVKDFFFIFPDF